MLAAADGARGDGTAGEPSTAREGTPGWLQLIAVASAVFIVAHDFVAVGIVIPHLQDDYSASLETAQWAIAGFSVAFAVAVVPGGKLADMLGAANTFVVGAFALAATSTLVALAPAIWILLAGRVLQGLAVGLLFTATIPLIFAAFGPARAGLAGAVFIGVGGLGTLMGPIDAGLLIEWLGWRAVFAASIPICLLAGFLVLHGRSVGVRGVDSSIDWIGTSILATGLMTLLITLRYGPTWGWGSAATLAGFAATALLLVVLRLQQRAWGPRALVPPDIVANRRFSVSFAAEALIGMTYFAIIALAPQVFVNVLGASPIESGLMLGPTMGAFVLAAALTGTLLVHLPAVISVPGAGAIGVLGGVLLGLMPDDPSYLALLPGLVLVGLGAGVAWSALITVGVSSLPEARAGLAGGLLYMAQLAGGGIGLAAVTALVTEVSASADQAGIPLVQGIQSGFLLAAAISTLGVVLSLFGYGRHAG